MSQNNVWEWLLKQSELPLLLERWQWSDRRRRRIVRYSMLQRCAAMTGKGRPADTCSWQLKWSHQKTIRSNGTKCSSIRQLSDVDEWARLARSTSIEGLILHMFFLYFVGRQKMPKNFCSCPHYSSSPPLFGGTCLFCPPVDAYGSVRFVGFHRISVNHT